MIRPAQSAWFLGLDLGHRRGHSALATIELVWQNLGRDHASYQQQWRADLVIRGAEQFRHDTAYLASLDFVRRRCAQIAAKSPTPLVYLTIDAGGPGMPIIEEAKRSSIAHANLRPTWITAGDYAHARPDGSTTVPRRELLSNLVLLLENGKLHAPNALNDADLIRKELLALRTADYQPAGSTTDDMIIALSLAAWQATRALPPVLLTRPYAEHPHRIL